MDQFDRYFILVATFHTRSKENRDQSVVSWKNVEKEDTCEKLINFVCYLPPYCRICDFLQDIHRMIL